MVKGTISVAKNPKLQEEVTLEYNVPEINITSRPGKHCHLSRKSMCPYWLEIP